MNKTQKEIMVWEDRVKLRLRANKSKHLSYVEYKKKIPSINLVESRKTFFNNIKHLNDMEKSSISLYLKNFIDKSSAQPKHIRTMAVSQKEQLLNYMKKRSPDFKILNLSDFHYSPKKFPENCYVKSVKNGSKNFLNKTSVLWDLCGQANLKSSEKKRLELLKKRSHKITNYSLTKNFIAKMDIHNASKDDIFQGGKSINLSAYNKKQLPISEYDFQANIIRLMIENLNIASNCSFFAFGHRAIFVPKFGSSFFFMDLYSIIYLMLDVDVVQQI